MAFPLKEDTNGSCLDVGVSVNQAPNLHANAVCELPYTEIPENTSFQCKYY